MSEQQMPKPLIMWVVTDGATDIETRYAARRHEITFDQGDIVTDDVILTDDLNVIRDELWERGLKPIARSEHDDPVIVESWL